VHSAHRITVAAESHLASITRRYRIAALTAERRVAPFTEEKLFAFTAERLVTDPTREINATPRTEEGPGALYTIQTIMTLELGANIAVEKLVPLGKIVTFPAAKPGNRFHLAVFTILSGARPPHWPKFRTVTFAEASERMELF
jgi:hypothetical protein